MRTALVSRTMQVTTAVALTLLWPPTLAVMAFRAAPHRIALIGTLAKAAQLIDHGQVREAERLITGMLVVRL